MYRGVAETPAEVGDQEFVAQVAKLPSVHDFLLLSESASGRLQYWVRVWNLECGRRTMRERI